MEVGRSLLPAFADGVWVAELGPLSDPELVPVTVAAALGLSLAAGASSPERVAAALGNKQVLLVLDNCEHVIEAAARMAEALLRASSARVRDGHQPRAAARTGRVRLSGARRSRSRPRTSRTPEDLLQIRRRQAVRRARTRGRSALLAGPQHHRDDRGAICRRLDGIPLAIELAAARTAALGVEGLAARLDDRFRLLTGGHRTALPRHQTLRATLDWSYELLPEAERVVLRRLAVFAGGLHAGGGQRGGRE